MEPLVGPPQAHSLVDEKVFPAAEQVPASARTCLIYGHMKTQGHNGQVPYCCCGGATTHRATAQVKYIWIGSWKGLRFFNLPTLRLLKGQVH